MIFTNIYRIISIILRPLINHWLKTRVKNGKEDSIRYIEKKGYASKIRPQGKLVWIHAVSVGESISSLSLINELEAQGYNVLLTTSTFTSGKLMKEKLPESVIHQYCPMDVNKWVKRFLDYWKPDLAIMIESELWVNILRNLNKRNVPIFLINARMSNKTMNMWRKIPFVAKAMFSYFDYITAQTQNYADFIKGFTNVPVEMIGNLKQASPAPDVNKKDLATLQKQIGNRPVWVVASTHPQDEIFIETAINKLHKQHINLLTIIVPRHPERLNEVKDRFKSYALSIRSNREMIADNTNIYIADTIGEMGLFYSISNICFVGGSTGGGYGGHNPLEPAKLHNAILQGSDTFNFAEITVELTTNKAHIIVNNGEELYNNVNKLLNDKKLVKTYSDNAYKIAQSQNKVIDKLIEKVKAYI